MSSEHRPRTHPIVNPEVSAALLRRLVGAWESGDAGALEIALNEASRLHRPGATAESQRVTMPVKI